MTCLDFFTAVPGIGADREAAPMAQLQVRFGDVDMPFAVGASSAAVPGVPAGCAELHARWGRLPWDQLVAPALGLARAGVPLQAAHLRMLRNLEAGLLLGEGKQAYAPTGQLLSPGETVYHPGLDRTLEEMSDGGGAAFYRGPIADAMVDAIEAGGGLLGHQDLANSVLVDPPLTAKLGRYAIYGRRDHNRALDSFAALPDDVDALTPADRTVALARSLGGPNGNGDTTNITVVDPDGNACVVTTTLGLGSGVWIPGYGVHVNSMLGEGELYRAGLGPGERVASMMCPLVATDGDHLVLAAGAAGASRIRTALLHTVVGVLVEGRSPAEAVARPRVHPVGTLAHVEPGHDAGVDAALDAAGYTVRPWDHLDHFFGGCTLLGIAGAGADPRRDGATLLL